MPRVRPSTVNCEMNGQDHDWILAKPPQFKYKTHEAHCACIKCGCKDWVPLPTENFDEVVRNIQRRQLCKQIEPE
jgi:hypothetical protein